jgi:ATP phosphoribosyltransferase regulatory subunit
MSAADLAVIALEAEGGDLVDPSILIEAAVPLELSGEAVRSRICTFLDAQSKEWALRPDLTLPVAQAEVQLRQGAELGETVRRYRGPVFRLPVNKQEPVEYEQIGLERFGAPRGSDADIWLFEALTSACRQSGVTAGHACFGDLSIFPAFVSALELPEDVAAGLQRAFRQEGGVRAYLSGQARPQRGLPARIAGMPRQEIADFVDDIFAMTGLQPVGERSADEIIERLYERSKAGTDFELGAEQSDLLNQVLSLDVPLAEAPAELQKIADRGGLNGLRDKLDRFKDRTERLIRASAASLSLSTRFATRFGRRFTYYDGFVFEISANDGDAATQQPFVAGGRYDSLLADLSGGAVTATALGGIIIPHRLEQTLGERS